MSTVFTLAPTTIPILAVVFGYQVSYLVYHLFLFKCHTIPFSLEIPPPTSILHARRSPRRPRTIPHGRNGRPKQNPSSAHHQPTLHSRKSAPSANHSIHLHHHEAPSWQKLRTRTTDRETPNQTPKNFLLYRFLLGSLRREGKDDGRNRRLDKPRGKVYFIFCFMGLFNITPL